MAATPVEAAESAGIEPTTTSLDAKYERFDRFLKSLWKDVYPEFTSGLHNNITAKAWKRVQAAHPMAPGAKVLDIGCGQGVALKHFAAARLDAIGIAIGEDVDICRSKGFNAVEMDLSFLEFPDESFDLVWCRHVLEHSVFPYFSLCEIKRVMQPGGVLYIEVPAPDTAARHQTNPNHYSVLTKSGWMELIRKAQFATVTSADVNFNVPAGPDCYWSFLVTKRR